MLLLYYPLRGNVQLPFFNAFQEFSFCASMAEHGSHHSSAWHLGSPSIHNSPTMCSLEHVDLGMSEPPTSLEQPLPSPDLEDNEDDADVPPLDPNVPYPDLAPVVFFCLKQTTSPRSWCIKMVCNPYPL